ncbi:MAG: DNA primase [Bacteroidales bacterium]|nr:DNA primase [Bacteroidales bacterium]MBR1577626.1 DNA primase [Bacteroidales bacterium]
MIPQETVNLILDTAQIADVVSDYVTLKRRGANFVACCPFHNEKTPSFYVSPSKGIYKCFGCGKAGTAVGFVMEQEHCSYVEALRYLARKYHIEIVEEQESAEDIARRQRGESLLLVSEFARKFFSDQLKSGEGRAVGYAYYRSRGIEDATIEHWGLGWAPGGRTALVDAARAAGYKDEYLLGAGLAVQNDDGSLSDKFRERVMFPIHSVSGRVIAFSGRTLRSDNPAKYVNSPETEIYVKSRNLLGIYFAKAAIAREDRCILVEGNVDVVMMHQLGITNVVASCGTSLTVEQVRLIKKFTENITIMYDGDSAGIHAALRGIPMVLAEGMNVRIVLLPDGDDPDSFSRKHTQEEVRAFVRDNEQDFVVFKTGLLLGQAAGDPLRKAGLINDIADTIAQIPDAVKRSTYAEATAQQFGIEVSVLFDRINRTRRQLQEDALKAAEREERRRRNGLQPNAYETVTGDIRPEPEPAPTPQTWVEENPILAPAERELLYFLLRYGCNELDFESDSDYYSGSEQDKPSVADFIRDAFSDGTRMANSAYAAVYDAYMDLYTEGYGQDEIVKRLLDAEDRRVAAVAAELSTEKYRLTVSAFERSMTTTESWLVAQVPRSILNYAERRMQDRYETLRRALPDATAEQEAAILAEMVKVQAAQRRIRKKLGREKNT